MGYQDEDDSETKFISGKEQKSAPSKSDARNNIVNKARNALSMR